MTPADFKDIIKDSNSSLLNQFCNEVESESTDLIS